MLHFKSCNSIFLFHYIRDNACSSLLCLHTPAWVELYTPESHIHFQLETNGALKACLSGLSPAWKYHCHGYLFFSNYNVALSALRENYCIVSSHSPGIGLSMYHIGGKRLMCLIKPCVQKETCFSANIIVLDLDTVIQQSSSFWDDNAAIPDLWTQWANCVTFAAIGRSFHEGVFTVSWIDMFLWVWLRHSMKQKPPVSLPSPFSFCTTPALSNITAQQHAACSSHGIENDRTKAVKHVWVQQI